ncbi:MAG: hypothetical protein V3R44_03540 [bacterium]
MRYLNNPRIWLLALLFLTTSCAAPDSYRHISSIDPEPFVKTLTAREAAPEGLISTLDVRYRGEAGRYSGEVFLVLARQSKLRLEVPGSMGSTFLVMVSDGRKVWIYYPGEGSAYMTSVGGESLAPYLPFPLPLDPAWIPDLIMGLIPQGVNAESIRAYTTRSGKTVLYLDGSDGLSLQYAMLPGDPARLYSVTARKDGSTLTVTFAREDTNLPEKLDYRSADGRTKADFIQVRRTDSLPKMAFESPIPSDISVKDLEPGQ